MFTFEGRCPYCCSDRGFVVFGMSDYVAGEYSYAGVAAADRAILEAKRANNPLAVFSLAGSCLACNGPVVGSFETSVNIREGLRAAMENNGRTARSPKPVKIYPEPAPPYTHPALPQDVREAFVDLQNILHQLLQPTLILTGCRAVLEAAVNALGGKGRTLYDRIADLQEKGIITSGLKDWADHIRLSGNEAAHEMKGTKAEAEELVEFTKIFLQFTFELPARIASIRASGNA